jgi:hypothetical protein
MSVTSARAKELSERIEQFLATYGIVKADYDEELESEEDKYASPDASILFAAKQLLDTRQALPKNFVIHSSWGSGGYAPYTDKKGRSMHDEIVKDCELLKL